MPPPAGIPLPNAAQDTPHLLSGKGTLLIHSCLVSIRTPGPSLPNCLPEGWPPGSAGAGAVPPQRHGSALTLTEHCEILIIPLLQLLRSLWMAAWPISPSSQFDDSSKLSEGTLCPIIQIIKENVQQYCP